MQIPFAFLGFALWAIAISFWMWRLTSLIRCVTHLWYRPDMPWYVKPFQMAPYRLFFQLILDIMFTIGFGVIFRLIMPGPAGGGVGAMLGIFLSVMIQGFPLYAHRVKQSYA